MPKYGTDILNHFDLPREITSIQGTFKYRFYSPIEQVDEANIAGEGEKPDPRYVLLSWTGNDQIVDPIGFKDLLVHRENLFFPSDLNAGYSIFSTDENEVVQRQTAALSDNTSTSSKLDYLLTTVASNEFTEKLEESISSDKGMRIPLIDPTTNRPIQSTSVYENTEEPPDLFIRSINLKSVIDSSNISPLSLNVYKSFEESADIISKESISTTNSAPRNGKRLLSTLNYALERLANMDESDTESPAALISLTRRDPAFLSNWSLIGYCVSKYRVDNQSHSYMYSRAVFSRNFRDPHVAYGKKYKYEIRPIYAKYAHEHADQLVILASDESSNITIDCQELKVPSPPKNLKFEYVLNNNINISWMRPSSFVDDEDQRWDTDDIKGYQIFVRNSLHEPYRLLKYFTFNNTYPRSAVMYSNELISDEYIITSEFDFPDSIDFNEIPNFYEYKEYTVDIRPNTDYFFAMCSIDAHGNSSNYSSQYKVRRDNVTGEVDIQAICPEGAPKQYPNLLVPGKLVQPSFKSSGYKYLDIYFNPDTQLSAPNLGEPALNIQMYELETQIEKNITVTIKEKQTE